MVSISKRPSRGTNTNVTLLICNKKRITAAIIVLVLIGMHCISWFAMVVVSTRRGDVNNIEGGGSLEIHNNQPRLRIMQQKRQQEIEKQQHPHQRAKSILMQLDQLSISTPLSSSFAHARQLENEAQSANNNQQHRFSNTNDKNNISINDMESQFLSNVRKECIPGRDDSNGEINPTTHRQRECLRHVPATIVKQHNDKQNGDMGGLPSDAEDRDQQQQLLQPKPRIGLMFPPGYIGQSFAHWIADALNQSRSGGSSTSSSSTPTNLDIELDILTTSHVPVYGYGKSHGYTKIIRFVTLPLTLAAQDAYLYGLSSSSTSTIVSSSVIDSSSLRDLLNGMKLGSNNDISSSTSTTTDTMGSLLQLILRWQCRLSRKCLLLLFGEIC